MGENKTKSISIRITKRQHHILRKRSDEIGFSISEYVLKSVFRKSIIINNGIVLKAINTLQIRDNKLENNINQIAKKLNSNAFFSEIERQELKDLISSVGIQRAALAKNIQEFYRLLSSKI